MITSVNIEFNKKSNNYRRMMIEFFNCLDRFKENEDYNIKITNDISIEEQKVEESINIENTFEDNVELNYVVPKSITFTSRFQDRISTEIDKILSSVYPGYFKTESILYTTYDEDNMKMIIKIIANNDKGRDSIKELDKNVEYIIKDLIEYYI